MTIPSAEQLLTVWERHHAAHPLRRALALLDTAWPQAEAQAWARVPVGERDTWLLRLFEELFGPQLRTVADCPRCGERLESNFLTTDIRADSVVPAAALHWQDTHYRAEFRLPTSEDLLQAGQGAAPALAARQLLQRCVLAARRGDEPIGAELLPESATTAIAAAMEQADPAADVRLNLACPACGHAWRLGFDIVTYLWGELSDWARRTLAEVHVLARAYGWSEHEILQLSPTRRQLYLELLRA